MLNISKKTSNSLVFTGLPHKLGILEKHGIWQFGLKNLEFEKLKKLKKTGILTVFQLYVLIFRKQIKRSQLLEEK